jgi:hypothetical protein
MIGYIHFYPSSPDSRGRASEYPSISVSTRSQTKRTPSGDSGYRTATSGDRGTRAGTGSKTTTSGARENRGGSGSRMATSTAPRRESLGRRRRTRVYAISLLMDRQSRVRSGRRVSDLLDVCGFFEVMLHAQQSNILGRQAGAALRKRQVVIKMQVLPVTA